MADSREPNCERDSSDDVHRILEPIDKHRRTIPDGRIYIHLGEPLRRNQPLQLHLCPRTTPHRRRQHRIRSNVGPPSFNEPFPRRLPRLRHPHPGHQQHKHHQRAIWQHWKPRGHRCQLYGALGQTAELHPRRFLRPGSCYCDGR